ncbi:MAG: hypothetical protein DDT22_00018 [candidate division WS2 bacterium]|nr:hypothetical protein [Candidatus Lithacetigena glycinireducens]MBT9174366.1 hypothetical protein [Candidatus Lithacetigena glycinireducens]
MSLIRILFLGDIIGSPGRSSVKRYLPLFREEYSVDMVVANGENLAGGMGLTPDTISDLFESGVDVVTSGNHGFDKKEGINCFNNEPFLIRPQNYPPLAPGKGYLFWEKDELKIGVLNLQGRVFMPAIDCPFRVGKEYSLAMKKESPVLIIDFHAEATSEKVALAHYLSGTASAVIGTHTHVQTADERLLVGSTLFISDVGMIGPLDSVIGMKKESIIRRFLTQVPERFEVETKSPLIWESVLLVINNSGEGVSIERIRKILEPSPEYYKE